MKVKIFDCTHEQDLEEEINYFLYEIDPMVCIRCGSCEPKCPLKAIKL